MVTGEDESEETSGGGGGAAPRPSTEVASTKRKERTRSTRSDYETPGATQAAGRGGPDRPSLRRRGDPAFAEMPAKCRDSPVVRAVLKPS